MIKRYFYPLVLLVLGTSAALGMMRGPASTKKLIDSAKGDFKGAKSIIKYANVNYQDPTTGNTALMFTIQNLNTKIGNIASNRNMGIRISPEIDNKIKGLAVDLITLIASKNPDTAIRNTSGKTALDILNKSEYIDAKTKQIIKNQFPLADTVHKEAVARKQLPIQQQPVLTNQERAVANKFDLYKLFNVEPTSNQEEVVRQIKTTQQTRDFQTKRAAYEKEIGIGYTILTNPNKRAEYDLLRRKIEPGVISTVPAG